MYKMEKIFGIFSKINIESRKTKKFFAITGGGNLVLIKKTKKKKAAHL